MEGKNQDKKMRMTHWWKKKWNTKTFNNFLMKYWQFVAVIKSGRKTQKLVINTFILWRSNSKGGLQFSSKRVNLTTRVCICTGKCGIELVYSKLKSMLGLNPRNKAEKFLSQPYDYVLSQHFVSKLLASFLLKLTPGGQVYIRIGSKTE